MEMSMIELQNEDCRKSRETNKVSKVYCKNCKHYYFAKSTITTSTKKQTVFYCNPEKTFNRSNYNLDKMCKCGIDMKASDCIYYKRKWYKIWIKEK